jgi:prolyl-tRNA synthetase
MKEKGIFILMPFVVRAVDKLIEIINYEMISINAQKLVMPTLVDKQLWLISGLY